uniref:AAA-ATPase-like domain-containing protein n=1 Tax=Ditylenchus dipsaci TaxID=166011 RepID=A0A915DHT5_9BILA
MSEVKFRKGTVSKRADRIKSFISPCAGSFSSLVQLSSIFVDKTLLIQDFYQGRNTHILLTLPRCMGKTTALTMCADFFSNLDTDINRQHSKRKSFRKVNIRAPTLIMNEEAFVKENMGAWPTIMFSLKYVVGKTKEAVLDSLRVQLAAQFERHEYLHEWLEKDKGIASKHKANVYLKYCKMDINEAEAIRGLQVLINHLHNHYKKRVILFVDDYDVPWTWSSDLRSQTESDQVHTFIYQFLLMTFSEQDRCIHRSIVAGSYRVASEQFDNNRLNLKHLTAIGNPLAKYFGFIEEEFHALCESYKVSPEHREVAKAYYNGLPIFHPNSTVEF